jgi:2-dehydropantoate 2-reductase
LSIVGEVKRNFKIRAETQIRSIPEKSLIILTTKAYDSAEAIGSIASLFRKDTAILVLQNGLGNEEIVRRASGGRAMVLRGVTKVAAEFLGPGRTKFWKGETIIESNDVGAKIAATWKECSLEARVSEHINEEVWKKMVVNCVVNPLTALFRVRNCEIWADSLETVREAIVSECSDVARAEGIVLAPDMAERLQRRLTGYTNYSSMYQDIARRRKTEIDFLNNKIVELGRKHGINTPVNETIVSLIKFLEEQHGISRRKNQKKEEF